MCRSVLCLAACWMLLAGCGFDAAVDTRPSDEIGPDDDSGFLAIGAFDFTLAYDRSLFHAQDMAFSQTVGPYAVYRVIGPDPELIGPRVLLDRSDTTWSMLCGAGGYFSTVPGAEPITMTLSAGEGGDDVIADSTQRPKPDGTCVQPDDSFSQRNRPDEGDGQVVEQLVIGFDPAPPSDSIVLIRRAGVLYGSPGHNDAHAIPKICCVGDDCGIDTPPEPDPNEVN